MSQFHIRSYEHDGMLLNLSGERDEDECVITRVTAADSHLNIINLVPLPTLLSMADRVDAQLSKQAREAGHYARVERRVMDRAMSQLPELTVVA